MLCIHYEVINECLPPPCTCLFETFPSSLFCCILIPYTPHYTLGSYTHHTAACSCTSHMHLLLMNHLCCPALMLSTARVHEAILPWLVFEDDNSRLPVSPFSIQNHVKGTVWVLSGSNSYSITSSVPRDKSKVPKIRTLQQPRSSFPCPVWEGIVFDGSLFMCVIIDYWRISDNLWCRSGVISPNAALRLVSWGWTRLSTPPAGKVPTSITRMCQSRESPAPGGEKWRSLTTFALIYF